jgi:hypothetical protein
MYKSWGLPVLICANVHECLVFVVCVVALSLTQTM